MMYDGKRREKEERIRAVREIAQNKVIDSKNITEALNLLIKPEDIVILEGDNQKQARFLADALSRVDPEKIHGLNMIIPSVSLDAHLDLFDSGIAGELNFAFAGKQSERIASMLKDKKNQDRKHPYIHRTLRKAFCGSDSKCMSGRSRKSGSKRQSFYRREHGGHSFACGSDGI